MNPLPNLAIVVPVVNDGPALERLLTWRRRACPGLPMWVVDGGSSDDSIDVAHRLGARVIEVRGGRGAQMNAGAAAAVGAGCDLIWFLHADAVPPLGAHHLILAAVRTGAAGGAFRRRFESPSVFLRFTCWLADWRCRCCGWFLGDQGIFATREVFAAVGGFPEWPWFEDLEFSRRTRRMARTVFVPATLLTSGRRFAAAGAWRQTIRDLWATCRYLWGGAPPARAHDQEKAGDCSGGRAADRPVAP